MKGIFALIGSALVFLGGCGSSGSDSSHATGSIYETSPPNNVSTIAGSVGVFGWADGTGTSAQFGLPSGVCVSADGTTLYVADLENSTIRQVVLSTGAVTTIAGSPASPGYTNAIGSAARFNGPAFIATDGISLFVTDAYNNAIRQIVIATGEVTTFAGSTNGDPGFADGTGTAAAFYLPQGIAITPDGTTLYVADYNNNAIRKIVIATGVVTTVATGSAINSPADIVCDGTGTNLYVTGYLGNVVQKIVLSSGAVSTLAGSTSRFGSADGTGSAAAFYNPRGITLLGTSLYVADYTNCIVRKIVVATGAVTTVAGRPVDPGSADGTGSAAQFFRPIGIATDGTNLYVGDGTNRIIRKIQ
jgi:DNA-binding beta-propeller fold protein YncE